MCRSNGPPNWDAYKLTDEEFAARQTQASQRSEADAETVVSTAPRTGDEYRPAVALARMG